jgi:hypothetical protein
MAQLVRVGDLEVPQDLDFEGRGARVRTVATLAGVLLLVVALLGGLGGSGPLADAEVTTPGGDADLSYSRFLQYGDPDELEIQIRRAHGGRADVAISNDYLSSVDVQDMSAQPLSTTVRGDATVYTFAVRPPAQVTFTIEARSIGRNEGRFYGPAGTVAPFTQWVYP